MVANSYSGVWRGYLKRFGKLKVSHHLGVKRLSSSSPKRTHVTDIITLQGISPVLIISKLLVSIMVRRLFKTRKRLPHEQVGFRSGWWCIDHIFTILQMLKHRYTHFKSTVVMFLDIRVSFNLLDRIVLWKCLLKRGESEKFINIIKAPDTSTSGRVRIYN